MVGTKQIRIKIKIIVSMIVIFILLGFGQNIFAKTTGEKSQSKFHSVVIDQANLLTAEEKSSITKTAEILSKEAKWNVIVATIDHADGKNTQTIGEELFNDNTLGDDGITCIIDMDNREIYINTMGTAISYLTDKRIDTITTDSFSYATKEDYAQCFLHMLDGAKSAYEKGIPDNLVIYNTTTGKKEVIHQLKPGEVIGALAVAFICGAAFFLFVNGKYKMTITEANYDYRKNSKLQLNQSEDEFMYEQVTHRHIAQNNAKSSGGGGSTTHTGAGGRTSGGGGHRF